MMVVLDFALEYFRRGYTPIYVQRGEKIPKYTGWQEGKPTTESLTRQFSRPANLGIRTGDEQDDGSCLLALDIDLEEHRLIRGVEMALGERVPVKRGAKGYTYFFVVTEQIKTQKIYWERDGGKIQAIDVLCRGAQTVVPPSIHPKTGQPYQWVAGTPLEQIDLAKLPRFTLSVIDEIRGLCRSDDPIAALNNMEWLGVGGGGNTHETCLAASSSMVTRGWSDEDIFNRLNRAKREACERAGVAYDWPQAQKVIQAWIDSARAKFPVTGKPKRVSHGSLAASFLNDVRPRILFDWDRKCWFEFTGSRWEEGRDPAVRHAIEQYLPAEARNRAMVRGIEESLRDRPELRVSSDMWDRDTDLLNTPGGTVHLKTAAIRPADPKDLITRMTAVIPDFDFTESLWCSKLPDWFGDEPIELDYVQMLLGYVCTGETREHCLPLWIGPGGDGKSVITGTCAFALGSYAGVATDTAFLDTRHSQHSEELAMLNGYRLVRVSEMSGLWREDRIKQVTGGESVTASFKNAHLFTYTPRFKLLVTANEPPRLKSVGKDMKRRFHVLKFVRRIDEIDASLPDKLRAEAGKVLGWIIVGAKRYYEQGALERSPAVKAATAEYFSDNDTIEQWIEECAELGKGFRLEQAAAYTSFRDFMEAHGHRYIPPRVQFQNRLTAKGIIKKNAVLQKGHAPVPALVGVRFKLEVVPSEGPDY